jgi:hypothetical protein
VGWLLGSLRAAGAEQQATALAGRLPGAGMFKLFLKQLGLADQFRFGREVDGSPSVRWGWEDLDYGLPSAAQEQKKTGPWRPTRCPLGDPLPATPEHRVAGHAACGNAVS